MRSIAEDSSYGKSSVGVVGTGAGVGVGVGSVRESEPVNISSAAGAGGGAPGGADSGAGGDSSGPKYYDGAGTGAGVLAQETGTSKHIININPIISFFIVTSSMLSVVYN